MNRDLLNSTAIPATAKIAPRRLAMGQANAYDPSGPNWTRSSNDLSAATQLDINWYPKLSEVVESLETGRIGESDAHPRSHVYYLMCGSSNAVLAPEPFDMRAWLAEMAR